MTRRSIKLLDKELFDSHKFGGKSYRADRAHVSVRIKKMGGCNVHVNIANVSIWSECWMVIHLPIVDGRVDVPNVITGGTSASVHVEMYFEAEYGKPRKEHDEYRD